MLYCSTPPCCTALQARRKQEEEAAKAEEMAAEAGDIDLAREDEKVLRQVRRGTHVETCIVVRRSSPWYITPQLSLSPKLHVVH